MTRVFGRERAFLSSLVMMVSTVYNGVCCRRTLSPFPFGVEACPAVGSPYTLAGIPPLPRYSMEVTRRLSAARGTLQTGASEQLSKGRITKYSVMQSPPGDRSLDALAEAKREGGFAFGTLISVGSRLA